MTISGDWSCRILAAAGSPILYKHYQSPLSSTSGLVGGGSLPRNAISTAADFANEQLGSSSTESTDSLNRLPYCKGWVGYVHMMQGVKNASVGL